MPQFVAAKAVKKHGLTFGDLMNLPSLVHAPVMIFSSQTEPGAFVTLIDRRSGHESLVVATHCLIHRNLGPQHSVRSVYPKRQTSILEWINNGLLLYEDKKKSHVWLQDSAPSN